MINDDTIYLDYAASTPPAPEVIEAMSACLAARASFANPSSVHVRGRLAAECVERARRQLAALLNVAPRTLVFTSGATESNNLAIIGAARFRAHRGRHLVTMRTEHKAVGDTVRALEREGFEVSRLSPQRDGRLALEDLRAAVRDDTQLVSIMHVNNETGVVQDIEAIGRLCRERDILFHTDAAQSVGKLALDLAALPVDLLSLTGHKFYGPQGIGALYVAERSGCGVAPILHGGGQERRLRPGTLPVHQVVGLGAAAELAAACRADTSMRLEVLQDRFWQGIEDVPGLRRNGDREHTWPGILNVSAEGVNGESLLLALEPVCVASGSACNSLQAEPSFVLRALGLPDALAQSAVRFSFGRDTSDEDVEKAAAAYRSAVTHLRRLASGQAAAQGIATRRTGPGYSDRVRQYFASPSHAGDASGLAASVVRGGIEVGLSAATADGRLARMRFRANGCPHAIAAAEEVCRRLEGRQIDALGRLPVDEIIASLEIPVEKTGLMLLLEDAAAALDDEISAHLPTEN